MKKFALIAMLVVIAVVLVTCDMLVPPEATEEWTDVEYEIDGAVGQERVKSIKLYFRPDNVERSVLPGPDTYGVRVSPEQKRIIRALTTDTAAASHDFFEAVFNCATNRIVRTTWEIGHPAGVSGSLLARGTALDYTLLTVSTVFVGRKANKTLLGVGKMTHTDDSTTGAGTITTTTQSVTFTIAPIKTWVGVYNSAASGDPVWSLRNRATISGDGNDATSGVATFTTANPTTTVTREPFNPVPGRGSVYYPLFLRPSTVAPTHADITNYTATYRIGGISASGIGDVTPAILVFGSWGATGSIIPGTGEPSGTPKGGMQVIKRKPAFLFNGRTYQAGSVYDSFTTLTAGVVDGAASGTSVNQTHGSAFVVEIPITFRITNQSSGLFALTFQCPVYAITTLNARQPGTPDPVIDASNRFVKWFIRPADGPDLYLLDSGFDEGGMVLVGDRESLSDDWIEIKTTGIGFQNN